MWLSIGAKEKVEATDISQLIKVDQSVATDFQYQKVVKESTSAFLVETFELPKVNPWNSRLRTTGFDFLNDGKSAIVSCWDGDVWRVDGLDKDDLNWRRVAAGLYQPLGVKIVKKAKSLLSAAIS